MTEYLLRVEGVNLASFLDDTNDLSTIRGGGLLLLQAVEDVHKNYFNNPDDQVISTGASSGLFRFSAEDGGEKKRADVANYLCTHGEHRHATFVVDVEELQGDEDFNRAREAVLTKNRLRQMRMPSVAYPKCEGTAVTEVCTFDAIRPACAQMFDKEGKTKMASQSVVTRREFGVDQKKGDFYRQQLGELGGNLAFLNVIEFSRHFSDIAGDQTQGNLDNKIAVLYLDGNAFGAKQTRCNSPLALGNFDRDIKALRRQFLHDLLAEMARETPKDSNVRLETLLWGGDEMMFVVPAWKGWWLTNYFFDQSRSWTIKVGEQEEELHHAAGLVFCHHNAPIARIKHLAKDLAELVKNSLGKDKPNKSACAYLTLESFDSVGLDVASYLDHTLLGNSGVDSKAWLFSPEAVTAWLEAFQAGLADKLAKRQVHAAAKSLTQQGRQTEQLTRLLEEDDPAGSHALEALQSSLTEAAQPLVPLHLALLWDYLACYQPRER